MSADDQRAAEAEYERLRTAVMGQAKEIDRLRAELAETQAAGDALAFAVAPIERMGRGAPGSRLEVLITRAEEWRSVRGDAPTAGGLLPDNRILIDLTPPSRAIPADQRRKLAAELRSRFVDGPVDEWSAGWLSAAGYIGSDSPTGTDAGTDLAARGDAPAEPPAAGPGGTSVVRSGVGRGFPRVHGRCPACRSASLFLAVGDHVTCASLSCPNPTAVADQLDGTVEGIAAAQAPAVELPVTLSSVDDVAAVCLAHGLTVRSSGPGWTQWRDPDTKVVVRCEAWQSGVERVTVAGRAGADIYRPVARRTVVAAIEAARGGFR